MRHTAAAENGVDNQKTAVLPSPRRPDADRAVKTSLRKDVFPLPLISSQQFPC